MVAADPADLILRNGHVWTVDPERPEASWVAIAGGRIVRLGDGEPDSSLVVTDTEVVDLDGRMLLPGFVDAHTHFENAVRGHFHLRLNHVDDEAGLLAALRQRVARVSDVWWITGGEWSSAAAARAGRQGRAHHDFFPTLAAVDRLTPEQPVLLRRHDGAGFINSAGIRLLHLSDASPEPANGEYHKDGDGHLTGALLGAAARKVEQMLPPHNLAQSLVGGAAMVGELNRVGIVGIHDIARVPEVSDATVFRTHVERSFTDLRIFTELRARDQLTLRVNPILTLRTWQSLEAAGITPGAGDDLIGYTTLKSFIGGFYMSRPFRNDPDFAGSLSFRNRDEAQLIDEIVAADAAGWDVAIHVTGDRGHSLVVDSLEKAVAVNPERDRRHRIVHAWYPNADDIERAGRLGVFGDITPHHLVREMPSMSARMYDDQLRSAFAWRDMITAGWKLDIVSDWPGSFDGDHDAPVDPLHNIWAAVTRRRDPGSDPFASDQAITVDEAIEAYTMNPARASRSEDRTGSITHGKHADVVVLSHDIRSAPIDAIRDARVEMTVFGGEVVHAIDR